MEIERQKRKNESAQLQRQNQEPDPVSQTSAGGNENKATWDWEETFRERERRQDEARRDKKEAIEREPMQGKAEERAGEGEREEREKKDRQEEERWERIERIEHELQSLRQATIAMQAQQAPPLQLPRASGVQPASNIDVPDQSSKSAARSATSLPRTDVDRLPGTMSSPISPVRVTRYMIPCVSAMWAL